MIIEIWCLFWQMDHHIQKDHLQGGKLLKTLRPFHPQWCTLYQNLYGLYLSFSNTSFSWWSGEQKLASGSNKPEHSECPSVHPKSLKSNDCWLTVGCLVVTLHLYDTIHNTGWWNIVTILMYCGLHESADILILILPWNI